VSDERYPIGSTVIADWQGQGGWYFGRVADSQSGQRLVHYMDSDEEWVPLERLASPQPVLGLRVLGCWSGGTMWYPGLIVQLAGERALVQYLDGDQEWIECQQIRMDDITAGDWVMADVEDLREYFPARVLQRWQDALQLELADGTQIELPMSRVALDLAARSGEPS
jgi:hypothetical protein